MSSYDFDLFVIGAGSGGVRAARMSADFGARVAIAESGRLGGTCVNLGCVPKKLMVYASAYGSDFEDSAGFGWQLSRAVFDWPTLIANKDREIERLNTVYRTLLESAGVRVIEGRARFVDRHTIDVGGSSWTAEHVLVATGGRPFVPPIPGAEHGVTSDEIFRLEEQPRRVVITGGGYIAVEFAGIFAGIGSEVTLNYRGPLFLRGFDDDIRLTLASELRKRGIDLRFETRIERIDRSDGQLRTLFSTGDTVDADLMLCAVGRLPNTSGMGLEAIGVELDARGAVVVDEHFRSSVQGVHAVGDCIDRIALTPVALAEGMAVARTLFGGTPTTVDYRNVPTAVFSQPEVSAVGLTEREAADRGHEVRIFRSTFKPMRHTLSGRDEVTMMKLVVDRADDRVLGVHMLGPHAGEIVQGMAVALKAGATKATFDATLGIHPTAAEEFVTMRTPVEGT